MTKMELEAKRQKEWMKTMKRVARGLPKRPNKTTQWDMSDKLGCSPKQFRRWVKAMRKEGVPVCAKEGKGYWLSKKPEEVAEQIKYYDRYINSMQHTKKQLEVTYNMLLCKKNGTKVGFSSYGKPYIVM